MLRKTSTLIVLIISIAYSLAPATFSAPQVSGKEREQKLIDKTYKELSAREEAIKKELSGLQNHPWAGEYSTSDGLTGQHVFIAPREGFSFLWHCCTGPCDLNYGEVKFENGMLKIRSALPNRRDSFQGIDATFFPILWGNRHYLIAEDEMIDFANSFNGGFEPATGQGMFGSRYLIKVGDEQKLTSGPPPVPKQYLDYFLTKPITAKILSVDSSHIEQDEAIPELKERVTVVTINAGYSEGVRSGMRFHTVSKDVSTDVEVTQISEHSCSGEITMFLEAEVRPVAGWQLSTRVIERPLKNFNDR